MLLFYLPFALEGLLERRYVEHFRLFSSAMYVLLKEKISDDEIEQADMKLNQFVSEFEILYGKNMVTMNVHLTKHTAPLVRKLGPLWSQSAYGFEANNGVVTKANTSTNGILHQLAWKYSMKQTIETVREETPKFNIGGKKVIRIDKTEIEMFFKASLIQDSKFLTIYRHIILSGIKFTSKSSKEISTIDFFVRLIDKSIAAIKYYVQFDFVLYAVIEKYEILNHIDHFLQIKSTNKNDVIRVNNIAQKMLYLKFGLRELVTSIPNKFEKT